MAIFELGTDGLTAVNATSFRQEKLRERDDLQRRVKANIACLEEGLMVLAEEYGTWVDSSRRIDLLCLDRDANLVVVELKRTGDGSHMELQAIRYAAMVSFMTFDQAAEALAQDRARQGMGPADTEAARRTILGFLEWIEPREEDFARDVRIILVEEDFGKELTTSVLWLRERDIDIRCIRMKPYRIEEGRLLVDIQQLIPLPEAAQFQTQIGAKRQAERGERSQAEHLVADFLEKLLSLANEKTTLHRSRATTPQMRVIYGSIGRSGMSLNYIVGRGRSRAELLLDGPRSQEWFSELEKVRPSIDLEFGPELVWSRKEGVQQCRIFAEVDGGYRSPETDWPAIHERLVDAMIRLDRALRSRVQALRT